MADHLISPHGEALVNLQSFGERTDKIKEASKQARLYSSGVLGGIEIANYRYLVMVSERMMKMPDNRLEGIVAYRHINIAVNPATPSVEARTSWITYID